MTTHALRRSGTSRRRFGIVAAVVTVVTVVGLGSSGAAWASWTAPARSTAGTLTTGSVAVTVTGIDGLAGAYSSSALTRTATVAVQNTGSVPSTTRLTLSTTTGAALSGAQRVDVWQLAAGRTCAVTPSSTAVTTSTGTTVPAVTSSLAAGATATSCVRTSVDQGQRFDLSGATTTVIATVTAQQGNWAATTRAQATQAVAATVTPGALTATSETDRSIALSWTAPADTSGIASYAVWRNGTLVGTVPASARSFTDTGLQVSTSYSYVVRSVASGPAGHVSPPSTTVQHATDPLTSSGRYVIRNAATAQCVTVGGTASGSPITAATCRSASASASASTWQFAADGSWLRVTSPTAPSLFWDAPSSRAAVLRTQNDISAQRWAVEAVGTGTGQFQLRNKNDLCLVAPDAASDGSASPMSVSECDGGTDQLFTLQATS